MHRIEGQSVAGDVLPALQAAFSCIWYGPTPLSGAAFVCLHLLSHRAWGHRRTCRFRLPGIRPGRSYAISFACAHGLALPHAHLHPSRTPTLATVTVG